MIKEAWHGGMPMSTQGYITQDYSYYSFYVNIASV